MEVIGAGFDDGIRCYDTATGEIQWRMDAPFNSGRRASGDINSDGRDEALFTSGRTLYCIGSDAAGAKGRVLWTLEMPAPVGPPVIADVDGSGRVSILLVGRDGYLYCVR